MTVLSLDLCKVVSKKVPETLSVTISLEKKRPGFPGLFYVIY
jgi:hypothetical protein